MASPVEGKTMSRTRRKSSDSSVLMTLSNYAKNIPIINEPTTAVTATGTAELKKKALRFDTNTRTSEYESEEVIRENKKRITDEIKK